MEMMVVHPETRLTVGTITRMRPRRWMLMLWDGKGTYQSTEWHTTQQEARARLEEHCLAVIGQNKPWPGLTE